MNLKACTVGLTAALVLTACSGTGLAADQRDDGPVVFTNLNTRDFLTAGVVGEVGVENGCFLLDTSAVVWPRGTEPTETGVRLPDGTAVEPGDTVSGGGGYLPADDYSPLGTDARVLAQLEECVRDGARDIAVFNGGDDTEVTRSEG